MSRRPTLRLEALDVSLVITRLAADAEVPHWASGCEFTSITRSRHELSIVCEQALLPEDRVFEGPFRAIRVRGHLEFGEIGIVEALALPLAEAGISIFVISSYDTDYVLVQEADFDRSVAALESAGHAINMA